MAKPRRYKAHLVVVLRAHGPRVVCAVMKQTPEDAVRATKAKYDGARVFLAGGFAQRVARGLGLKPDEIREV